LARRPAVTRGFRRYHRPWLRRIDLWETFMRKVLLATLASAVGLASGLGSLPASALDCASTDIDATQRRLLGGPENICETYGGKVLLVTNVASHCGFTKQYEGLEKLYRDNKDKGLVVLGFPSGDFRDQEFQDDAQIAEFCKANFGDWQGAGLEFQQVSGRPRRQGHRALRQQGRTGEPGDQTGDRCGAGGEITHASSPSR
jgi:glutathione peroxidase-family protein